MGKKKKDKSRQDGGANGGDEGASHEQSGADERLDGALENAGDTEDPVAQRQLLIDSWNARNELYNQLFGPYAYVTPANYGPPLPVVETKQVDLNTVHGGSGDPGDPQADEMHLAVLAYAPDPFRHYWTYVTAGLCSPWLQQEPDEVSGFGCELAIKSPHDSVWQARILRSLAYYIFNHAGTISPGVRINLNAPINEHGNSQLRNLLVWYLDEAPDTWYILPSGGFALFCAIGITDKEQRFAETVDEYGTWCIHEALRSTGHGQISNPERQCLITDANAELLNNYRIFANNFGADLAVRQQNQADE